MNYIEQINVFWKLDAEHSFSGNETRLYFYLLDKSNSLYWKNPLANADGYTATIVGISVNTLKSVRNRLQQVGLITFKSGGQGARNKSLYTIIPAAQVLRNNAGTSSISGHKVDTLSEDSLTPYLIPGLEIPDDNSKRKPDKTKHSLPAAPGAGKKQNGKKEKKQELPEPHWEELVKVWFDFNVEKFGGKPSFEKDDPRILKRIIGRLKKRAADKQVEWTRDTSILRWKSFLTKSYEEKWLSTHFLLSNLENQFDTIILNHNANGTTNGSNRQNHSHQPVITGTATGAGTL
jgi:hypothetical protein